MTNEAFRLAFQKYVEGQLKEEERKALMEYITVASDAELDGIMREKWLSFALPDENLNREKGSRVLKAILDNEPDEREDIPQVPAARPVPFIQRWWVAAAAVLLFGTVMFWWMNDKKDTLSDPIVQQPSVIQPGQVGAILTLADGKQVSLDSIQNGVVALQDGATARVVNGELVYDGQGSGILYNQMSTRKGRQYNLILPDGTQVWLNSASSIRYPTAFTGKERAVTITGEAYFEVAGNSKLPFRVNVDDRAEIQVLGTSFNVNAYTNEPVLKTTLLEGSVLVSANRQTLQLKPGEQAQLEAGEKPALIRNVDTEKAIAWKNGYFNFNDADLYEIMRQLERWYDIEVVFTGAAPPVEFNGKLERNLSLQQMLEGLQHMQVKFKLEGRKLIIEP